MVVDPQTVRNLVVAILLQAVDDWKALNWGEYYSTTYCGQVVYRGELYAFFMSEEFESMCEMVFEASVSDIRKKLRLREARECMKADARGLSF